MEQKRKDIKCLEATISHYESSLGRAMVQPERTLASDDDHSDSGTESATEADIASTQVADDAPSVSTTPESLVPPPGEEQTQSMDVDYVDDCQPPASPVSHREDELLTGGNVVGVEGEMANLKVSSPRGHDDSDRNAST